MRALAIALALLVASCGEDAPGGSSSDADSYSAADSDTDTDPDTDTEPACTEYDSTEEDDTAPVQTAGAGVPAACAGITWSRPADYEYLGAFSGTPGYPAAHEGVDYVHDNESVAVVPIWAAADGVVAYVRTGCPQSEMFGHNDSLRECGAGWGNHVVVEHGDDVFTRYGHLLLDSITVEVGDPVTRGDGLATMGNSGRSETRHLHFELGDMVGEFDPCAPAHSFDAVYDSELLTFE